MPRSVNSSLWNFPGGFSDWLNKAKPMVTVVKEFEGRPYNNKVQIEILEAMKHKGLTEARLEGVQARKILNSLTKAHLIKNRPVFKITEYGMSLINATAEKDLYRAMQEACLAIHFWDPLEEDMDRDFDIRPFVAVLRILLELDYISAVEIQRTVLRIKNEKQIWKAIDEIRRFRDWRKTDYEAGVDEINRASWMISLFASTNLILRESRPVLIKLNLEESDRIQEIIREFFPDEEKDLENILDVQIRSEILNRKIETNDGQIDEFLIEMLLPPGKPEKKHTETNSYKRNTKTAEAIKKLYDYNCQICGVQLKKKGWTEGRRRVDSWEYLYAETAHISGHAESPELDYAGNMLCLCPNCHKNLDNEVYKIIDEDGSIFCKDLIEGKNYKIHFKNGHKLEIKGDIEEDFFSF